MKLIKGLLFTALLLGTVFFSACNNSQHDIPVEDPAHILSSFMNFWLYWNEDVKLSRNYVAYNDSGKLINRESFLKKLLTGKYLPIKIASNDSIFHYTLLPLKDTVDKSIPNTIIEMAGFQYHYFQMEGKPLPGFNFVDLNGNRYNQQTCKDKIVVINSWFIGCQACMKEMPALNKLVRSYQNREDILFVSLAYNTPSQLKRFLTRTKFDYVVVPDMRHYLVDTLHILQSPTHYIINKKGLVVNITTDYHEMERALKQEASK